MPKQREIKKYEPPAPNFVLVAVEEIERPVKRVIVEDRVIIKSVEIRPA
jgi:hypothetical protein